MHKAYVSVALWGLLMSACAGTEPPTPNHQATLQEPAPSTLTEPEDRAGSTRAQSEVQPPAPAPVAPPSQGLRLSWLEVDGAEDGRGERVSTERALAFDVDARHFAPGARDPVLLVGELELRHYEYLPDDVLRFVLAVPGDTPTGAPVILRYGESGGPTVQIAPSFEAPR